MRKRITIIIALATLFLSSAFAQEETEKQDTIVIPSLIADYKIKKIKSSPTDSVAYVYNKKLQELSKQFSNYRYTKPDTLSNPYYFYLFAQPTFYSGPMRHLIGKLPQPKATTESYTLPPLLPEENVTPTSLIDGIARALTDVYTTMPELITEDEDRHLAESGLRDDVNKDVKPTLNLTSKVEEKPNVIEDTFDAGEWDIVVRKPNFWTFRGNFSLQMMQYYVSDNWYKGGESHNSWLTSCNLEANYNNKQKITFDNKLEMRIGFQSSKDDKKHNFLSYSDQIRLTNKFGLRATKHWYYTLMLQSSTQFYPRYKKNDPKVYSDFMSPFDCISSIGMDFKLNVKNFNLNATISPFAGNLRYMDRLALSPAFGLKKDKHTKFTFGSTVTVNYNWNIAKNISWNGRIFYFTDYDMAKIEWENKFNLKINNFLSTNLFLYPRFDDSARRKPGKSYFQFYETLSLGFNNSF